MNYQTARKARGAFFTPSEMAEFIVRWAVRDAKDCVLEPSCGEAAFLIPTVRRLSELGTTPRRIRRQVFGAELFAPSAADACALVKAEVGVNLQGAIAIGDFFERRPGDDFPQVDACVGNPPYVRYQDFAGVARRNGRIAALEQGVAVDGLASSWAPFVVHAASFVKPGGRLGLVLPAELLSVNYAASVRRYLLNKFASVRVVLFEERVFPGVQEEVVLLLAEGCGPCERFDLVQVENLKALPTLESREWSPTPGHGKWTDLLLPGAVLGALSALDETAGFSRLGELAKVSIGMVTGANDFFCLSENDRLRFGIALADVEKLLPPGSKSLSGYAYGDEEWQAAKSQGAKCWLFRPRGELSRAAGRYIATGVREGREQAYKCRVRSPWFQVPQVDVPDLFMTYMTAGGPRFVENTSRVHFVNSVHGIYLREGLVEDVGHLLPIASMSTATLLSAELAGRAYGGGLLKLEPREAANLCLPGAQLLARCEKRLEAARPQITGLLARNKTAAATQVVDEIILVDGLRLDEEAIQALRSGLALLQGRRLRRSRS